MKKIFRNVPWALVNLGIIALVAFALFYTKNLWSFIALFFMFSTKASQINTKCPKCDCEFVATSKDDDEDE